jgi:hypothetical protein
MRRLLWIFLAIFGGIYINRPLVDPDLWWHISVGRWIVAHGWVPYVDYWNAFAAGKPWVAYSWTQEVLFAVTESRFGLKGLLVLQTILFASVSLSLCLVFSLIARDWLFGLLVGFVATCSLGAFVLLRPQTFVWIYFALLIWNLTAIIRNEGKVTLWSGVGLIGIMSLWANSHISTVLGMGLCVAWPWMRVSLRTHMFIVALAFTGTLLTPYGGAEWWIFLSKSDHPFSHGSIIEFGPATIRDYGTGIYLLFVTLAIVFGSKRPQLVYGGPVAAAIILGVGGLGVVKFLPFAVVITAALVAEFWSDRPQEYGEIWNSIEKLKEVITMVEGKGLLFLVTVLLYVYAEQPFKPLVDKGVVPNAALDFIIDKDLPHPILNAFGEGGYVMYRLSDSLGNLEHKVTIDGRTNVNPSKIAEIQGLAYGGRLGWHDYLDQVHPQTVIWKNPSPLTALLVGDSKWCRVYCDGSYEVGFSVFVTREFFDSKDPTFWASRYCADVKTTCFRDSDMYS